MSEMVERVAKAIEEKYAPAVDPRAPYAKVMVLEAARAAIAAMREPTKKMLEIVGAGLDRCPLCDDDGVRDHTAPTIMLHRAMIDAALKP